MFGRVLAGVAVLAAVAGCGEAAPEGNAAAVGWAEQVCRSVGEGAATLAQPPRLDPANPAQVRDGMVGYLGQLARALDTVSRGLGTAGVPPVADGAAAAAAATTTIGQTRAALEQARAKLGQAPVSDPAAFQRAVGEVGKDLAALTNVEGPVKDLRANPELNQAFAAAGSCKALG
ncbi:hypothetical protein [Amycolatopsis suaedae]|uniref:Lipoprotein n=1 Tax=Amycolatopsis suaedae TaxID=2510978 RepID=A0A4Q7JD54_9PSEU|nr:hypothetical protein [Amycolatopsis suaedae]RZQ65821.1 hypothetical protein EWH70_01700 [Amycolatopsis suaedae]